MNELVKKALSLGIGPGFIDIRKLLSAGLLTSGTVDDPAQAAGEADKGVWEARTSYQVGEGNLSVEEAIEQLIDRAATTLCTYLKPLVKKYSAASFEEAAVFAATKIPVPGMDKIARPVAQVCGKLIGEFGEKLIDHGIRTLASVAKRLIKEIPKLIQTATNKILAKNDTVK